MRKPKRLYLVLGVALALLVLAGCGGGGGGGAGGGGGGGGGGGAEVGTTPTALVMPTYGPPIPGKWTGTAEFGTFNFIVGTDSKSVTYVEFVLSNFDCKGTVRNDTITEGDPSGTGKGQQVVIDTFTYVGKQLVLSGQFDKSGGSASGTWSISQCGESGTWTATPAK